MRWEVCLATIDLFTFLQGGCRSGWLLIIWSLISWLFDEWPIPHMYHSLGLIGWLVCLCVDLSTWRLHRGSECSPDGLIDFLIIPLIGCLSGCDGDVEICLWTQPQLYLLTNVVSVWVLLLWQDRNLCVYILNQTSVISIYLITLFFPPECTDYEYITMETLSASSVPLHLSMN